jgi:ubiquinone biosynthesis monooxygenase Coq7
MSYATRRYSIFDQLVMGCHNALQAVFGPHQAQRSNPAQELSETVVDEQQRRSAAALMRINHVGEVCAQALYQGQSLTARSLGIKQKLSDAAQEEVDHLAWCQQRITELGGRTSFLNPLWYIGSFTLGAVAGLVGDKVSLGFLAETEHQVEQHLTDHLQQLPKQDHKSRKILEQMRSDEIQHAQTAEQAGAVELPAAVQFTMRCMSKIMTTTAYWV